MGITEVMQGQEGPDTTKTFLVWKLPSLKYKPEVHLTYNNYVNNSGRTQKILFYIFFTFLKTKPLWKQGK